MYPEAIDRSLIDCVDVGTLGFFPSDFCGTSCSTIQQKVIVTSEDYQVILLSELVYVEKFKGRIIKGKREKMVGNVLRAVGAYYVSPTSFRSLMKVTFYTHKTTSFFLEASEQVWTVLEKKIVTYKR